MMQTLSPEAAELPSACSPSAGTDLRGKRVGMVTFSCYPADPRPRRAIDALRKHGAEIDLICLADEKEARREREDGLQVLRIPISHTRGGKFSYAYKYSAFILLSAGIFATRHLRRRYDLIHVHNMPDVLVASALLPKIMGAKVLLDMHDPMPELMATIFGRERSSFAIRLLTRLERWSMARADFVVTVNVACKRIFAARSCRAEKIGIVMNAPDETIFSFRPAAAPLEQNRPFSIMYHGSLVERNGLDLAVRALAVLRPACPEARLLVYGKRTPFLDTVLQQARDLGVADGVDYRGPKRLEELVKAIQECDVGVIPNHRSAFADINTPTRIFEYLASGKPVIAPRTPGICDYFDDGSLVFFESGNSGDLAAQMAYVLQNRLAVHEIVQRGQKIYQSHSWREERLRLVGMVAGLIGRKPPVQA